MMSMCVFTENCMQTPQKNVVERNHVTEQCKQLHLPILCLSSTQSELIILVPSKTRWQKCNNVNSSSPLINMNQQKENCHHFCILWFCLLANPFLQRLLARSKISRWIQSCSNLSLGKVDNAFWLVDSTTPMIWVCAWQNHLNPICWSHQMQLVKVKQHHWQSKWTLSNVCCQQPARAHAHCTLQHQPFAGNSVQPQTKWKTVNNIRNHSLIRSNIDWIEENTSCQKGCSQHHQLIDCGVTWHCIQNTCKNSFNHQHSTLQSHLLKRQKRWRESWLTMSPSPHCSLAHWRKSNVQHSLLKAHWLSHFCPSVHLLLVGSLWIQWMIHSIQLLCWFDMSQIIDCIDNLINWLNSFCALSSHYSLKSTVVPTFTSTSLTLRQHSCDVSYCRIQMGLG